MTRNAKKLNLSSATVDWHGELSSDHRPILERAYGITFTEEAWADVQHVAFRYSMSLSFEKPAAPLSEARKTVSAVNKAADRLIEAIEAADTEEMDRAATRRANDKWELVYDHCEEYDRALERIRREIAHAFEGKSLFVNAEDEADAIIGLIRTELPSPDSALDFKNHLAEYRQAMGLVARSLSSEATVTSGDSSDACIILLTEWAIKHRYPNGASNARADFGETSPFVALTQAFFQLLPPLVRPTPIRDSSMTQRIIAARKRHAAREARVASSSQSAQ